MDPVLLLLRALALGAAGESAVGEGDVTGVAYRELIRLLTGRLGGNESARVALSQYVLDPVTWRAPLAKELVSTDAISDESVIAAAWRLMRVIEPADAEPAEYRVFLHGARGMQIGEGNHQVNVYTTLPRITSLTQGSSRSNEDFHEDVIALLHALDKEARTGKLPPYLPPRADVSKLARTVRARYGIRSKLRPDDPDESSATRAYQLPVERADSSEPVKLWPEVATQYRRLIVLADPGLGKSWLIRTETHRLSVQALDAAAGGGADTSTLLIPVPVRCDQLVAQSAQTLGGAVAQYLVAQGLMPARSQRDLEDQVETGGVVMLLDALDELVSEDQYSRLAALLRGWQGRVGDQARCVITSRIAGFRGTPLSDAHEVELQAFTPEDVTKAMTAWRLPRSAAERVLAAAKDPGVAGLTRVPLLLALLCSLATALPDGQRLPSSRGELYEQVLHGFLSRAHRAGDQEGGTKLPAETVENLLDILAPVAFYFATFPAGWADLMQADELKKAIRLAGPLTGSRRPASVIVGELSIGAGILVPVGNAPAGHRSTYLFLHRSIAEYLVARYLAALPAADRLDVVGRHLWFDPDWAEVIPLLGGQLERGAAQDLIAYLLDQEADPFHHALLTALRVMAERADPDEVLPPGTQQKIADGMLSITEQPAAKHIPSFLSGASSRFPQKVAYEIAAHLNDPDPGLRTRAVQLLAKRNEPSIKSRLALRLSDEDPRVRLAGVEAMRGRSEKSRSARLVARLRDTDLDVRWAAAEVLRARKNPGTTRGLVACLEASDPGVRLAATSALAGHDGGSAAEALLNCLHDPDHDVRLGAVNALAARKQPNVTEALLDCLEDSGAIIRIAAATALADRGEIIVTDHLLACFDDPHPFVRMAAVKALSGREATIVTGALLAALSDGAPDVQRAAFQELAKRTEASVVEAILSRLTASAGWWVPKAIKWLSRPCMSPYTDRLVARLRDPDPAARSAAASALSGRREPEVVAELRGMLQDNAPEARAAAAMSLAGNDQADVISDMLKAASDPDPVVRKSVIGALSPQAAAKVTQVLIGCCDDADLSVRIAAVSALAARREDHVTDCLLRCADSPRPSLRAASLQSLMRRKSLEIAERLIPRLDDPDPITRTLAVQVLAGQGREIIDEVLVRRSDLDERIRKAAIRALSGRGEDIERTMEARPTDPDAEVRAVAAEVLAEHDSAAPVKRKGMSVTEELLRIDRNPQPSGMGKAVESALAKCDSPDELMVLVRQIKDFDPVILGLIYNSALRMVTRVYGRLPESSCTEVRIGLAWLTKEVSRKPFPLENHRLPPRGTPVSLATRISPTSARAER